MNCNVLKVYNHIMIGVPCIGKLVYRKQKYDLSWFSRIAFDTYSNDRATTMITLTITRRAKTLHR